MTNLNELHNLPIEEFLNHMNWVAGYEEDQHKVIAIEIYNGVQKASLEEYEDLQDSVGIHDQNLHSLIENFLYNGFTMNEANINFVYYYCLEMNQYIVIPD